MEYILQVFTGGWKHSNYPPLDIQKRVSLIKEYIPVKAVIIGWNPDKNLYNEIGKWLHSQNIKMYLWLPVLSEVGQLVNCTPVCDLEGNEIKIESFQEDEDFEFYCPSDRYNWRACIEVYEKYFMECPFDGVFLDKIRTQTAAAGKSAVFSCGCDKCRKKYSELGVDLDDIQKLFRENPRDAMALQSYSNTKGFTFKHSVIEKYFDAKSRIIASGVCELADYFHKKDMEVGLDLFAPIISKLIGQDYELITEKADFIKPMMYRKTDAPAGIGFEYKSFKEGFDTANTYPTIELTDSFMKDQLTAAQKAKCSIYPGIEINYREDVARTDERYVRESIGLVKESEAKGAVLSWDVMQAPVNHIKCLAEMGE